MHVIVIGAGIIGTTTAYALQRRGHSVTLVERQSRPARGTSHANGGILSAAHCAPWAAPGVPRMALQSLFKSNASFGWKPTLSLHQMQWLRAMLAECNSSSLTRNRARMVALGVYSRQCLNQLEQETGLQAERLNTGSVVVMHDPAQKAGGQRHAEALTAMGFNAQWLDKAALLALEPGLAHSNAGVAGGIWVQDDGSGDCELFTRRLMQRNQEQGVQFLHSTTVQALASDTRVTGVKLDEQTLQADAYVVAAGNDSPALLRKICRLPVYPVKGYSMTLPVADAERAPRRVVLDDANKLAIARFEQRIRVAGVAELAGFDTRLQAHRCQQLLQDFEHLYPGAGDVRQASFWAGLRPMTPDGTPIVGGTPLPNLYVNTGHGTYGWTMASGSAELLADLMTRTNTSLPASHYAWPRSTS